MAIGSNVLIYLTPITFGGYSSELKKAVDRFAFSMLLPFFKKIEGEIHHHQRYHPMPKLIGIGVLPGPDQEAEQIFTKLVERNAINLNSPVAHAAVFFSHQDPEFIRKGVRTLLGTGYGMSMLATILVGSPKGPRSVSDALGTYLLERLKEHEVSANKLFIQQALVSSQGISALLSAVAETDIIILAAPLYADSHHSGVIRMMELVHVNQSKLKRSKRQSMTAISNSGFPEAVHNDVSLAISRKFAMDCGFEWAGGLALGGGQSLSGRRLEKAGGRVRNVKKALDLAAAALAKGEAIPEEAVRSWQSPWSLSGCIF